MYNISARTVCVWCACTGFVGRGCQEYPDELEGALRDTATTGVVRYVISHAPP